MWLKYLRNIVFEFDYGNLKYSGASIMGSSESDLNYRQKAIIVLLDWFVVNFPSAALYRLSLCIAHEIGEGKHSCYCLGSNMKPA